MKVQKLSRKSVVAVFLGAVGLGMLAICFSPQANAAITAVTIDNTTDYNITSATVDGTVHNAFVGYSVTAYGGSTGGGTRRVLATENGSPFTPTNNRAALLESTALDEGFVNIVSMNIQFDTPVVNGTGNDIFLLDIGTGDSLSFTINSTTNNHVAADFTTSLVSGVSIQLQGSPSGSAPTDLTSLESFAITFSDSPSNFDVAGLAIDLSDFGVANGGTVSSISVSSGAGLDPLFVGAVVPEPSTYALVGIGLSVLFGLRRLQRKK